MTCRGRVSLRRGVGGKDPFSLSCLGPPSTHPRARGFPLDRLSSTRPASSTVAPTMRVHVRRRQFGDRDGPRPRQQGCDGDVSCAGGWVAGWLGGSVAGPSAPSSLSCGPRHSANSSIGAGRRWPRTAPRRNRRRREKQPRQMQPFWSSRRWRLWKWWRWREPSAFGSVPGGGGGARRLGTRLHSPIWTPEGTRITQR